LDSKTANWAVRVVYEHHPDNEAMETTCEGSSISVASGRGLIGRKEGISEELFPFNLPNGNYACEVVLVRRTKDVFRTRTATFAVVIN